MLKSTKLAGIHDTIMPPPKSVASHQIISGMIIERHNIACRLIMKAIEAGSLGGVEFKCILAAKSA